MAGKNNHLDGDDLQVVVSFVIPQGRTEITEALDQAFTESKKAGLAPLWVEEQEVLNMSLTKMDVLVMDPFSGLGFNHVTSDLKCTLVGPRCLLACLASNTPVPELPYPVYTAAMKGMIITTSGLERNEKDKIKLMVEQMAGTYSDTFHDGVTHLVAATTRSQKYEVAVEKETPCMLPKWVEEVWKLSTCQLVSAVEPRFIRYRCPALLGVTVSVSQLNRADKELLRRSVETHGGVYSGVLEMDKTSVLVCTSPDGDKYSHAKKWKIPCVSSEWVFDCIEEGYCLQTAKYRIDRVQASSGTAKQDQIVAGLAEVSMSSILLNTDESTRSVDDTINCSTSGGFDEGLMSTAKNKTTAAWLAELELCKVKKAGMFLDGCRVFLSGFTESEQMQLARVLKYQIQQPLLDISQMCRTVLSHISPRQGDNKAGLEKTEHSVTVVGDHDQVGENYEVKELEQPVASLPHKYIHPLNDVKRYQELVRRTSSQSQLPPTSPYNYVMDCTGYRKEGGDQNLNTPGNRQSWGSTLPQYNEFLI
eukprot:GFUD01139726.1.p1 GENE.GFUD01139726.1~~GFUD01139726.1.p1  ORF type:complete len:533 (-),score=170.64 GFUD01139726.1:22-1620(-)